MSRFEDEIAAAVDKLVAVEFTTLIESITPEAACKFQRLVSDLQRELRVMRQAQLTIVVDRTHQGRPMSYESPDEGRRIELSWDQANRVHQLTPLRLHQVISEDAAEFVPAVADKTASEARLPAPPYRMPIEY
ncbi:MAG: hypothetical protein ABW043_06225 [Devosia sp.]|uniref:hypothetical protein n=1 Tax=Devosia sp. TaxID=1871048 RepID=UPI00339300E9